MPEFEILSVCGLECLPQRADLVAVPAFELGELGGEGADHAARLVRAGCLCVRWVRGLLPGPELLDPAADLAVDSASQMLALAVRHPHLRVRCLHAGIETLELPGGQRPCVISRLALHYIGDHQGPLHRAARWLRPGGHLIVRIEHPVCTAMAPTTSWLTASGHRTVWPVDNYARETARTQRWPGTTVIKYHHRLSPSVRLERRSCPRRLEMVVPAKSPAEVIRRFAAHLSSGELDELVALYEPDAVYFARPGQPLTGGGIRSAFARLIEHGARMSATCERAVEASGLALVNNRWSVTTAGQGGTGQLGGLSCVVLRQRADGTWGVVIDDPWASR